jgi:hypothetical protein
VTDTPTEAHFLCFRFKERGSAFFDNTDSGRMLDTQMAAAAARMREAVPCEVYPEAEHPNLTPVSPGQPWVLVIFAGPEAASCRVLCEPSVDQDQLAAVALGLQVQAMLTIQQSILVRMRAQQELIARPELRIAPR